MTDSGARELAYAVCKQAAKDYAAYYLKWLRNPSTPGLRQKVKALRKFFKSNWYYQLAQTDEEGSCLLKALEDRCRAKANVSHLPDIDEH